MFERFSIKSIAYLITIILFVTSNKNLLAQSVINPDSALQKIISSLEGTGLSLYQAQNFAKDKSTAIKQAEANYLASLGTLRKERGAFDPELFFNINYEDQKIPSASFFAGANVLSTQQTETNTGFRLSTPIGTQLELSLNTINLKTNSQFAFLNPQYNGFGLISLRQPLLSGFTLNARKNLNQAELMVESEKSRLDQEVIRVNSIVEQSYWNLYAAERNYAVQKLTVERAESFLKEAQLREKAGLVGPNQVANARTFWAQQKLLLIDKSEQLDAQSDQLANLIGQRPEIVNSRYLTNDSPPNSFPTVELSDLIDHTLNSNLELLAAQKNIQAADDLVEAASWELLPQVDLVGSLNSSGLGGSSRNVIFGGDTLRSSSGGTFGDVLSEVFKRKFPGWSIGIEVSLPIGLRPGLGEKDRLEAGSLNAKQNYVELSRLLEQQVRESYRELTNGNERLKIAREGVDAAQEQVRIGMIEFQNGRLSAFELVRLSEDFAIAQQRYSDALVKTVKAAAELRQLTSGYYPPR